MTRERSEILAGRIKGHSRYEAERSLVLAGLSLAGAASVVAQHLGIVSHVVICDTKELASCIFCEGNGGLET